MADLYVLEGRGNGIHAANPRGRGNRYATRTRRVPGITYGDPIQYLGSLGIGLGPGSNPAFEKKTRELQLKAAKAKGQVFTAAEEKQWINGSYNSALMAKIGYTKSSGNILERAAKGVADAGSTVVRATQSNVLRPAAGAVATGTRATVKAVGTALDVTRRMAKRAIKTVAKKVLFKGDSLLGSAVAAVPKNAAKGVLIPAATAAVLANPATAAAAPIVPVLVNEVIDELYNKISDAVAKGLSPEAAAKKAQADLDTLEPGEENDPKFGSFMPIAIGVAAILALVVVLKKKS